MSRRGVVSAEHQHFSLFDSSPLLRGEGCAIIFVILVCAGHVSAMCGLRLQRPDAKGSAGSECRYGNRCCEDSRIPVGEKGRMGQKAD